MWVAVRIPGRMKNVKKRAGRFLILLTALATLVCDICYNNTKNFFGFKI